VGVPFPKGLVTDASNWAIEDAQGTPSPVQVRVLERWSDRSIRWALVDSWVTRLADEMSNRLLLCLNRTDAPDRRGQQHLTIEEGSCVRVSTGVSSFVVSRSTPALFQQARFHDEPVLDGAVSELRLIDANGHPRTIEWRTLHVEEKGSLRAVVVADGEAKNQSGRPLQITARLHFFAGLSVVRLLLVVRNPSRAEHRGGIWELGDEGSALIKELSLVWRLPAANSSERIKFWLEPGASQAVCASDLEVYQESSGGEHWASSNHVNRQGVVPVRFRGYRGTADGVRFEGARASPIVVLDGRQFSLGVALPHFWQNCPRAVAADLQSLTVSFFPGQYPDAHELQGGEQKTHECWLLFGSDTVTEPPLTWCRSRVVVHPAPTWYAFAGAVPYLAPAASDTGDGYRILVATAVEGPDSFERKRETIDEYGWRHFGDIYGDHEAVFREGPAPLVSHYNNQYDAVAGLAYQFMRTGDLRWWTLFQELATHVIDIDIYHTHADKAAYNQGMFWHTVHYVDAGKSTHRSYPSGTVGGGPSSEHNYITGLMLHYLLTGSSASREAVVGLSQFVIDIDDGSKTPFSWLDKGYTGLASASRTPSYHGPGRGSGNSLNALVDGHRVTGERRFLDKAEQIIRRCTHPRQELNALTLLDAENRWFYTMFLQALGKYLDHKIGLGELDAFYGYARAVLLHYARWMAAHEYPYLDKPEILEFPTETWAAQDLRKSEVFDRAAAFAEGEERLRFLERAEFFFDHSIATLQAMPTRRLCRPVVLLLGLGFMRNFVRHHGVIEAPAPREGWERWPVAQPFLPQKLRAKRRAMIIAAAGVAFVLLALTWVALG
jgi:YetA-like protein